MYSVKCANMKKQTDYKLQNLTSVTTLCKAIYLLHLKNCNINKFIKYQLKLTTYDI